VPGSTSENTINLTMKPEDHAWRSLQGRASAHLRDGFADRVLRAAHGPRAETWRELQAAGARRIRPGFAERVLRAARKVPGVPSLLDQFAFSAATAAVCVFAVVVIHGVRVRMEDERNLAGWQQLADDVQDMDIEQFL
jgi:hypothetical protein